MITISIFYHLFTEEDGIEKDWIPYAYIYTICTDSAIAECSRSGKSYGG